MKKRITFALMAIASSMMSIAHAEGFDLLVFKAASGDSYSVETQGLEIYYKDGQLSFNNDNRSIPVATLVSMEFTDYSGNNSGVEGIVPDSTDYVTIISTDGIKIGEFQSLSEAYKNIKPGMYIVSHSNGETYKIKIEK